MRFFGRAGELGTMEAEYARDSSFLVIYGRRRVGKTTLIKEFIKDKLAFYFLATEEIEQQSMKRFSGVIARTTGNLLIKKASFDDWLDLLQIVAEYEPGEKKVLVIDEFPYLVKTNAAFPSVLQHAWDEFLKDSNVMLILCGSLLSMMQKHALSYESPLYGRRTAQIRLLPLSFMEVYQEQNLPFTEAVEQYAVTGGVPKYLEFFQGEDTLIHQIEQSVLAKNGFLYEEPNFLLRDEVLSAVNYFSIMKVIADGNHKLGNISGALNLKSSDITPYLSTLMELGFLEKRMPVTEKNPEKSRRGLYFISDNFMRFWFRYVYPYKGELELDNRQIVLEELERNFVSGFVAFAYEDICKNIFAFLCRSGKIPFFPSKIGTYWKNEAGNDTELDVVAVDHKNCRLFVGECKYHERPVDAEVYFHLADQVRACPDIRKNFPGCHMIFGIFSKSGFTDRLLDMSRENPDLLLIQEDSVVTG